MAETTFGRRAVNDGKLVHRLREGKRITIDTLDRIQAYIAASTPGGAAAAARARSAAGEARSARQFPLLREPAEIPAVRPYLQREAGDRRAGGAGAVQPASPAAGAAGVRRRRRRRHGAGAGDALDARPLSPYAVLYRRQGAEPGGRPADARQGAGPAVRAPGDRVRPHQHVLRRGALADAGLARGGRGHDLARGRPAGGLLGRIRDPDRRIGPVSGAELAGQYQPQIGHADL